MDPNVLILFAFFGVMYFFMIRPQRKRQQEHQQLIQTMSVGDDVVTIGGIHGRVVARDTETVDLQVSADGTVMRFQASAVSKRVAEQDDVVEAEVVEDDEDASSEGTSL